MSEEGKWARITAIATIFIAVFALGISLWQGMVTRTHNRLSVRPNLQLLYNSAGDDSPGIYFINAGSGPAIITKVDVFIDGKRIDPPFEMTLSNTIIAALRSKYTRWVSHDFRSDFTILPGDKLLLIGLRSRIESTAESELFSIELSRISLYVEYKSVYDEPFAVETVKGLTKDRKGVFSQPRLRGTMRGRWEP